MKSNSVYLIKMKHYKIILLLCLSLLYQCKSIPKNATNTAIPMDIYLCIGQSNMAGRAVIEPIDKDTLVNVYIFTGNKVNLWEKAANPFNKYSSVRKKIGMQKLSPSYGFAKTMAKTTSSKIGLVVNAKGGTSIEEWEPGALLYKEAIKQTQKALQTGGVLKGIIWHQGESNASKHKKYLPLLIHLIEHLRADLKMPDLPFVAGQLSPDKPKRKKFNNMILTLPEKVKNTGVVRTDNTATIDQTHFDSASQRLLGERYALEMLKLIRQN